MIQRLPPGRILYLNVGAHAILFLAFSFLPYDFGASPYWCRRPKSAKVIDMTCSKMFPIKATTCSQVGPMSLDWLVDPFARFDFSRSSPSPEVPSGEQQRGALPASTRSRWRQDALQAPPQILQRTAGWDGCGPFFSEGMRCFIWNTRFLVGSVFSRQKEQRIQTQISQKTPGQQQHYLSPRSAWKGRVSSGYSGVGSAISVFCTFILENENGEDRLSAFTGTFYLKRLL